MIINKEFSALPRESFKDLTFAMDNYQRDNGVAYRHEHYGEGLEMLAGGQGRCLFFTREAITDAVTGERVERLIALLVYKKEGQKAPKHVLQTARDRMRRSKEQER